MLQLSLNWSRCAPNGHTISLNLIHLDLENSPGCEHDALEISADGHQLIVLCGKMSFRDLKSQINPTLVSPAGGCLSLLFHSDYSNTQRHTGFRGFYTIQDYNECEEDPDHGCSQFCHNYIGGFRCSCKPGYHLDQNGQICTVACSEDRSGSLKGVISSPSWPGLYAENAQCSYTLSVEEHLQLVLEFSGDFDVEQGPDTECLDYLMVETPSRSLGPFCGQTAPSSPILTGSHLARIIFITDGYGSNHGFTINYKAKGNGFYGD
ncbi:mannan-binding lectin serine protease 1-like [Aplochiton taeniatus]